MDPHHSAQDVVRCALCMNNLVQCFCECCEVELCESCIGKHISEECKKHEIVLFKNRKSTLIFPVCKTHSKEKCKGQCKTCNSFICAKCCLSDEHSGHNFIDLEDSCDAKKKNIERDMEKIKMIFSPTYEEIRKELESQISGLDEKYEKLTAIISKQGDEWHKEIDSIIKTIQKEINDIKLDHKNILTKHMEEIIQIQLLIQKNLDELDIELNSNVVSEIMEYRSMKTEYSKLPPKVHVSMPNFCFKPINREQFCNLFGYMEPLTSPTFTNDYTLKIFLDDPYVLNSLNTGYKNIRSICFQSELAIWMSAEVSKIKCFNREGKSNIEIKTKSGKWPSDIAVTIDGCLVYTDWDSNTVNRLKNEKIDTILCLMGWIPLNLFVTPSGDLLVTMCNDAKNQCKVDRYSVGYFLTTEKQTIQFEESGKPLYSGEYKIKYITENRNLDICVADLAANAVVVVDQAGKLRFRYTGHPAMPNENLFNPRGIATNSQSQILTADSSNNCIHILDQDGKFLRYIDNVNNPFGLCVDKFDNLLVADYSTGDVNVIRYLA